MPRTVRLPESASVESPLLDRPAACRYLQCGRTFLREHEAEIGVVRLGSKVFYLVADLDAFVARRRTPPRGDLEQGRPARPRGARKGEGQGPAGIVDFAQLHGPINPVTGQPWGSSIADPPSGSHRRRPKKSEARRRH